jgi:hypothetical protein
MEYVTYICSGYKTSAGNRGNIGGIGGTTVTEPPSGIVTKVAVAFNSKDCLWVSANVFMRHLENIQLAKVVN